MAIPVTKVFPALTRLHLAWAIEEFGWTIGDHTYGQPTVLDPEYAGLSIGRFCSIGPGLTIVLGNHRTDLVTTYPFRTLSHLWPTAADGAKDHDTKGDVVIGDDVWFGARSMVLSGARIGPGAVVAAHAVVRGEVPPYAIVAGNPAKVVRYRFNEPTIARLLTIAWWNWPEDVLRDRLPLLLSVDIAAFLDFAEQG